MAAGLGTMIVRVEPIVLETLEEMVLLLRRVAEALERIESREAATTAPGESVREALDAIREDPTFGIAMKLMANMTKVEHGG